MPTKLEQFANSLLHATEPDISDPWTIWASWYPDTGLCSLSDKQRLENGIYVNGTVGTVKMKAYSRKEDIWPTDVMQDLQEDNGTLRCVTRKLIWGGAKCKIQTR